MSEFDAMDVPDDPRDPWWEADGRLPPFPDWVLEFRPWQVDAARELVDGWERGAGVMMLDAPTGTGKTIIGEMCRRAMFVARGGRATYVCHSLRLQDQFLEDFPYASVVKGRGNYLTEEGPAWVTASDCTGPPGRCTWCVEACPYLDAKAAAMGSGLAIANTSYWLHETNYVREGLRHRRGLIIDECDTLEAALMGFVEVYVSDKVRRKAGVGELDKGVHAGTVADWMDEVAIGLKLWAKKNRGGDVKLRREVKSAMSTAAKVSTLARELREGDGETRWVRDYPVGKQEGAVVFKPVKVDRAAVGTVWGRTGIAGNGWALAMSASFVSGDEWADSCGVEAAGLERGVVRVDSPFPVANRPIIFAPCGDMKYATWEQDLPKMVKGIATILERHVNDAILIHTTSYKLNRALVDGLRKRGWDGQGQGRELVTHDNAAGRDEALARYERLADRGRAPVVLSPSLDRGVDLPGDKCRVMVVAKIPAPSLGDRQVSERLHEPGGRGWYATQIARTLIQMTGRGVRSVDDHATTYILDAGFGKWWRQGKHLMPAWWSAAVKSGRL